MQAAGLIKAVGRLACVAAVALASLAQVAARQLSPPAPSPVTSANQQPLRAAAPLATAARLSAEDRADIMMARKRFEEALDLFGEALDQHPKSAMLYNKIGIAHQQMLQMHDAERSYKQAIKLDPKLADAYNNLGTIYYEHRNYKKAIKLYDQAISRRQDVACFYVNRGTAEFMRNHVDKTRVDYTRALQLDPSALDPASTAGTVVQDRSVTDPARFHFLLARLYCGMGRLDDAMHQFRQALEQHYSHWKDVYRDEAFKPLRARKDFQSLMARPATSG
jgi:tetratricopeptide (TPR) repeat protein